jgi:hypothetical protein
MRWHKWAGWKDTDKFINDALIGVEVEGEAGVAVRYILELVAAPVQSFIVVSSRLLVFPPRNPDNR